MRVQIDRVKFTRKPAGQEIGGIKSRMACRAAIKDLTAREIAAALASGQTVQPGVTPFSGESRKRGCKGTVDADFTEQSLFMNDHDNKRVDIPKETPAFVAETLARYGLAVAFAYETFSSTAGRQRFRIGLVSDEPFTDRAERDRVQAALVKAFPQSDPDCINAGRIFFGTDKGLLEGIGNIDAVCRKADLLVFAAVMDSGGQDAGQDTASRGKAYTSGQPIPEGTRNSTMNRFALQMLTKYGESGGKARTAYDEKAAQCVPPLDSGELETAWNSALRKYRADIVTDKDYIAPDEYAAREFGGGLEPRDYTDVGEARVFVSQYGARSRYSTATKWLVYDGRKWNESELKAQGLAQELTDRQLAEARARLKAARGAEDAAQESGDGGKAKEAHADGEAAKKYRSFVLGRRKTGRIAATLTEARPALEIDVKKLDCDPFLLNTPGGTVDLRTCRIKPHDPNDFCTKMTAATPAAEGMEIWKDFLDRITCGDKSLQDYDQICSGMELVGKVFCENLIIAHGSGGNGKSTFYNAKFLVMGDYAGSLSAETLTVNCRKNKSPEYAELRGKRFVIAAELEEGMRLDTAVVKKLCSTDPIKAEKKFKDPFEFLPSHTTILYTNHLPKVGTNDKGTWDRLVVVPFPAKLRGVKGEVKNYADYLFGRCGGAILLWMIEGAKKFIDAGYTIEQPQTVRDAVEAYRQENDWLNNFLAECCDIGGSYSERAGTLFDAYKAYCAGLNEYVRHVSDFKAALVAAGYNWRKDKAGAHYYGLRLNREYAPVVPP